MSSKTQSDMISLIFLIFGIIITYVAISGIPILYDSLDSHQKTCQQFDDCTLDLEQKWDGIDNVVIYMGMIIPTGLGIAMIFLGIAGIYGIKIPILSKKEKNNK